MAVAIAASVLGLLVVLVAYYRDPPLVERSLEPPHWGLLPDPGDVARTEFPLSFPGYEPATVEFHFELLTRAYADLLAVAPPDVVARARHRAALRRGVDLSTLDEAATLPPPSTPPPAVQQASTLGSPSPDGPDVEALRTEAALADLDAPRGGEGRR